MEPTLLGWASENSKTLSPRWLNPETELPNTWAAPHAPEQTGLGAVADRPQIPVLGSSWLQTLPAPLHSLGRQ